jgi:hypothetical protein
VQPNNAIIGDEAGIDLPQAPESIVDLSEEKKMARYSRSKEFKRLKEYMEGRIEFFQTYLPDGRSINSLDPDVDFGQQWKLANLVIAEFQLIINEYERINQVVEDDRRQDPKMV